MNRDDCTPNPCFNGGRCTVRTHRSSVVSISYKEIIVLHIYVQDQVNGFECQCASGYHGDQCETERDECASNPCSQNAIRCHVS